MLSGCGDAVRRVSLILLLVESAAMAAAPPVSVTGQRVETAAGLHVVTFDTLQGTVTVNLPDDMAAGDTISGTVIASGSGKDDAEKSRNQDSLSGTVVELEEQKTSPSEPGGRGKWILPAAAAKVIPLILRDREGRTIGKINVPVAKQPAATKQDPSKESFQIPPAGQTGRPVAITGPFDGDFTTSSATVGGEPIEVLAESPRKLIARSPTHVAGPTRIEITKGTRSAQCDYHNISIKLAAPKLTLKSGERTTMTITVEGAEGFKADVPVSLVNKSPTVVHIENGDVQVIRIDAGKLSGRTSITTRGLIGVMPGGFNILASLIVPAVPASCTTTSVAEVPKVEPKPVPEPERKADRSDEESDGGNWDFEEGLRAWTPAGDAFRNQPTLGDNVVAERVRMDMTLARGGIGGDYWKRIPYPIGHHAAAWVGTYENRPEQAMPLGTIRGDGTTGTLTSGEFPLDEDHRFIAFVIGGGSDVMTERVELQVRGRDAADLDELERIVPPSAGAYPTVGSILAGGRTSMPSRDGDYVIALTATGQGSEVMRPVVFEVPETLRGRRARIRIVDESTGPWGHINADDFRFGSERPPDRTPPVWGFADTHAHPMNTLSFGGNLVQGSLYARDGSVYQSDQYRQTALPPLFENLNWAQLGAMGGVAATAAAATGTALSGLLSPFFPEGTGALTSLPPIDPLTGAVAAEIARAATRPARMGYPQLRSYPAFHQMLGQQMYGEWIYRAYEGGLRLMTALAVNTWLVSSHPVKRLVLGSSAPEDDQRSADVQVADIKAWAARPENRGWVEVALTPADARRIIGANKLAVVIGLELDVLGNFVPNDVFTEPGAVVMPDDPSLQRTLIEAELNRLYRQGVRQVGPFHYVSGVFGGCAMFQRMFNEVNRKLTGRNVEVESGAAQKIRYRLDMDGWDDMGTASRIIATGDPVERHSDPSWSRTSQGHINAMGLNPAGEILFDEMIERGMVIDIDHASFKSTERLLELATERRYPLLSSHSDFLELGFTGPDDFSRSESSDNHLQNHASFDTTILAPLRNEGMAPRAKVATIAALGGVSGPIMWLPRRKTFGDAVPNDCDGSSKTWAQSYQYAVAVSGGRGVALSTDRITMPPRFGPNAAHLLGQEHASMPRRDERRYEQVAAQGNGVRYDRPIREIGAFRFAPAGPSAWEKTPIEGTPDWESAPFEHGDAWKAIAAWAAGRNPRMRDHGIELSGDIRFPRRTIEYAWGLTSPDEEGLQADCGIGCDPETLNARFGAYCAKNNKSPGDLAHFRNAPGIWRHYRWVKRMWEEWQRMNGTNEPLRRHIFGTRDFDVNLDGVAHYGMLPDFLQDIANSHTRPAEVGTYLDPLFRSAEDYIRMWELGRQRAGLDR